MSDDRWDRYRELHKAYNKANRMCDEDWETPTCTLCMEVAEFLLQPYWDMLNETKDNDVQLPKDAS